MIITHRQLRNIIKETILKETILSDTTKASLHDMIDKSWKAFWHGDEEKKLWWSKDISTAQKMTIVNLVWKDVKKYFKHIKKKYSINNLLWSMPVFKDMIETGQARDILSRHMGDKISESEIAKGLTELIDTVIERSKYAQGEHWLNKHTDKVKSWQSKHFPEVES